LLAIIDEIDKNYRKAHSTLKLQAVSYGMKPKMHRTRAGVWRALVVISRPDPGPVHFIDPARTRNLRNVVEQLRPVERKSPGCSGVGRPQRRWCARKGKQLSGASSNWKKNRRHCTELRRTLQIVGVASRKPVRVVDEASLP
jgi:hypothetical protein